MIFREIWSEHSLIDEEQKGVGEFFYLKYFFRGGLKCSTLRELELGRSIKRQPIEIKKC